MIYKLKTDIKKECIFNVLQSHLTFFPNAQYTPPTRRNCRVSLRRRCVHEFATSWRQFRRVVGVNTPVGSRELGHGRRLRCAFASPNPSAVVANSCTHRRRDATKQFRLVGGVYWALVLSIMCDFWRQDCTTPSDWFMCTSVTVYCKNHWHCLILPGNVEKSLDAL